MEETSLEVRLQREKLENYAREAIKTKLTNKINTLETLLCGTCSVLDDYGFNFPVNPELDAWWANHQKADSKRKAKEAKRRHAEWLQEQALELMAKPLKDMDEDERMIMREAGYLNGLPA